MAVLNWGDLTKNAEDSETIEQAIVRIIAEHNADQESHVNEGQSLQSHKAAEIIDHRAGSVLADKLSNKEFLLNLPFESLDNYTKSASGVTANIAGFKLDSNSVTPTTVYLHANGQFSNTYFKTSVDVTFQFFAAMQGIGNHTTHVVCGGISALGDPPGIGFKIVNNTLYAIETVYGEEDNEEYTVEISGVDVNVMNSYRVEYNNETRVALYYVNAVLRAQIITHDNADNGLGMFTAHIQNNGGGQKIIRINGVYIGFKP